MSGHTVWMLWSAFLILVAQGSATGVTVGATPPSGKEKAHKVMINITKLSGDCPGGEGGLPTGWPGGSPDRVARGLPTGGQRSKVYVLCVAPKEHKHFRPCTRPGGSGTRPGGSVTGVTEKLFMCQMSMCLFWPLTPVARSVFGTQKCRDTLHQPAETPPLGSLLAANERKVRHGAPEKGTTP